MQIYIFISPVIVLLLILLLRTIIFRRKKINNITRVTPSKATDEQAKRLSEAIKIRTEGYYDKSEGNVAEFNKWEVFIDKTYPNVFKNLEKIKLSDYAYIYIWKGKNRKLKPICFMSHFDVVVASNKDWKYPPFSGTIAEGKIWGRGTLDTKNTLIAIMESCEDALVNGVIPKQDIYLVFGGDEETTSEAAQQIRDYLKGKNVYFDWVWDEGSAITDGLMEQCSNPLALIGVAEKGSANIEITSNGSSGHSGMPPKSNTLVSIAQFINKYEKSRVKRKFLKTTKAFFSGLAPYVSFQLAVVFSNIWFFSGLLKIILSKSGTTRALIETTGAATMAGGSAGKNILPDTAFVNYNFRIIPGDSRDMLLKRLRKLDKKGNFNIRIVNYNESSDPVPEAEMENEAYSILSSAAYETVENVVVLPNLVTVTTDSKYMNDITDNIYRLSPMVLNKENISTIHSQNEAISLESYGTVISFYKNVISKLSK